MQNIFTNFIIINKREQTNITKRVKFINGWLISIAGLQLLWKDLKSIRTLNQKENYVLYTSRLNQDSIENLFCTFRQQNGNNTNPTPYQLLYAFKKNFLLNYFQHSQKANCINDLDAILAQMPTDSDLDIMTLFADKTPFQFKKICPLSIGQVDYRNLEIPDQNAFIYVCGYIMSKCLSKHSCEICLEYAKTQKNVDPSFLLCFFKAYENAEKTTFGNLNMPHEHFYNYIYNLESEFINSFPIVSAEVGVGNKLKIKMLNIDYEHPCPNFDKDYLLNFFCVLEFMLQLNF